MHYVYILKNSHSKFYTGVTEDLKRRVEEHNTKQSDFTSWSGPYTLEWYCAFKNKAEAYAFEKYLKSSSGAAFRNKHLV